MLIMFPLILTNINLGFFWLYVRHNSGQLESLGSFGHCAHPLQIFHLLIFIIWIVHLCKKIICSVCVRLIHLNSANKVEVEVELRAYSCWICCLYKISKSLAMLSTESTDRRGLAVEYVLMSHEITGRSTWVTFLLSRPLASINCG